jgi:hypothetical protein
MVEGAGSHGAGEDYRGMGMSANPLDDERSSVALEQPARGEGDHQPHVDGQEHGNEKAEPGRFILRLIHGASILIIGAVVVAQLAWIALLAYGVYWVGARLAL